MKRASTSVVLCITALIVLAVEARANGGATQIGLVPSGSVAVLMMNWGAVRRDTKLKEVIKGDDLERIMDNAGISGGDVTNVVIFLDMENQTNSRSAMVMTGSPRLLMAAEKRVAGGWSEATYRGYKLYTDTSGANCLTNLKSGFVALGTRSGIEAVINTELSPASSILTDVRFRKLLAQSAAPQHPISLVMVLPQSTQDAGDVAVRAASFLLDFTIFSPLGKLLNEVGLARGIGFSMTHSGNSFPVSFVALMKDENAATLVSGTFSLLKGATSWLSPPRNESAADREMRESFQTMIVTRVNNVVSIRISVPETHMR